MLTLSRELLMIPADKRGGGGVRSCLELSLAERMLQGFAVSRSEYIHQTAECVVYDVSCLVVPVRAGLSEVGDRDHYQRRIIGRERVVIQTERRHHVRREILHKDVSVCQQSVEQRYTGRGFEVESYALLVRIQVCKQKAVFKVGFVVCKRRQSTGGVALKSLHLDYVGPKIGEELGAVRTGDMVRQVEYSHAL